VLSRHGRQNDYGLPDELRVLWTSLVPQSRAVWDIREAKDFLHAAIAVGGHNQNASGKHPVRRGDAENDVVVKLTLLPMVDELVCTPTFPHALQESAEHERSC